MTQAPTHSAPVDGRWKRRFFTIWTGQQLSLIGSMLGGFALVWYLTRTTGSAVVLATATLMEMLPRIVVGPFVGALVDRWDRRAVMIVADSIVALFSAWLAYLFWANALQIWHVYLIMGVRSIGSAFHWPAMSASTSLMVPEKHLARVAGLNQAIRGAMGIAAPPLGAMLLEVLPIHGIMAIDVITAALAVGPLFFFDIPRPLRTPTAVSQGTHPLRTLWHDVHEGLLFVWHWSGLRTILIMALVINFVFTPAMSLMPLLVTQRFHGGAAQLGWMNSAWGAGVVLGGLLLSAWGGTRRRVLTSLGGLIGLGVGALAVGMAPGSAFGLALGAMLVTGSMNPITNGPLNAVFQSVVPPDKQGRVFSLIDSAASAMAPLGMAIAGPVADVVGIHTWFILSGVVCVGMAIIGLMTPVVMHLEENHGQQSETRTPAAAQANVGAE
jgi:DHA3 family macrolide efflux protein-like MFS transporter